MALIPGLAWDRNGNRLGRGGGYYDRLLAGEEWRAFRCGIFLSVQKLTTIPHDPWDSPLDAVVTEAEIVRFAHRQPAP
jgi:5-formyltetrahydrofolate cyclo-ligase